MSRIRDKTNTENVCSCAKTGSHCSCHIGCDGGANLKENVVEWQR